MLRSFWRMMRAGPSWRRGGVFAGLFAVVGAVTVAGSYYAAAPAGGVKGGPESFRHPYGGELAVWPRGEFFAVGLRALDDSACESVAGSYAGQDRARQGVVGAMVTRTAGALTAPAVADDGAITGGFPAPWTAARVSAACRFGDGANDLYFVFAPH